MNETILALPPFHELSFQIDAGGTVIFDSSVFEKHRPELIDQLPLEQDAPDLQVILCWYLLRQAQGGSENSHLEQILSEVEVENDAGQGFSFSASYC